MDKKKAIKIATSTAVAAAAFVAVSPAQAASPSEAVDLLEKAENLAGALKWEVSFAGHGDGTNQRGKLYADTNLAYEAAQEAVAALGSVRRAELNPRLDQVGVVIDRAMRYYDAVAAGQKLVTITNDLNAELLNDVVTADTVVAYRALMPEFRKAERIMSNVYGKSTRDGLRAMYQQDARDALNEAMWPVNVFVEAQRLEAALEVDNEEEATRRVNNLNNWLPNLTQQKFKDQLEPVVAELLEAYDAKYGYEAPIPEGRFTQIEVDGVEVTFAGIAKDTDEVTLNFQTGDVVYESVVVELVNGEFETTLTFEDLEVGTYEFTVTLTVGDIELDTDSFEIVVVEDAPAPVGLTLGELAEDTYRIDDNTNFGSWGVILFKDKLPANLQNAEELLFVIDGEELKFQANPFDANRLTVSVPERFTQEQLKAAELKAKGGQEDTGNGGNDVDYDQLSDLGEEGVAYRIDDNTNFGSWGAIIFKAALPAKYEGATSFKLVIGENEFALSPNPFAPDRLTASIPDSYSKAQVEAALVVAE